jgi:hypothetical protein
MTYRVVVTREDHAWLADLPEMQGAHTESPATLGMLDLYCREVATLMDDDTDIAMDECEFQWELHLSDDDLVDAIAQQRGVPRTDVLARGWSLADVAALLSAPVERVTQVPPPTANVRAVR